MASVFRARDTLHGSTVALKALRIDPTLRHKEERIAQFHREYRTLAEIAHPRVIHVFDYGVDAEGPYYTMELLDGADLSVRAPLPWREACALLRDVSSSLALLHSRGYVHRDVSPLNVRCTADGRAKLIDFGAMAAMGVSTLAMGTPPCVAPEALARQPLDGRTDLFALGATLYFTLTNRQAYYARTFTELRAAHERPIRPPSAYAPDVPPAVDRLVLSLLSLDPMARPRHAAEVMDRLTTLAELGPLEPVAVRRSYLNTPALVGREAETTRITQMLADVRLGQGRTIRISAARGGGRSRVLHATVMDARLAGMLVVQADAAEAAWGPYGVLQSLLSDLRDSSELAARQIAAYPELEDAAFEPSSTTPREAILKALSALAAEVSEQRPLLIAVDSIEHCDEPSLAALVTLAASLRKRALSLVYTDTLNEPTESQQALGLLRELSGRVELAPLTQKDVEGLLASVFGAVPNLQLVSRFLFERAFGNPRASIELAQALVDRGLARYELGSWSLPSAVDSHALPRSLLEVRSAKLASLSKDAVDLAQILALAEADPLSFEELKQLSGQGSSERLEELRAELIEARVVAPGNATVFADSTWADVVRATLDERRSHELNRRLAFMAEARGAPPIQLARYFFRADEQARALDVLCGALQRGTLVDAADADYADLLQDCTAACTRLGRPPRDAFVLSRELMVLSDRVIVKDHGACFWFTLEHLKRDSGLAAYEALPDTPDRLTQALTAAQASYDATPEAHVLSPIDAIRGLVEATYSAAVYAAVIGDPAMLDRLPNLQPLIVLSPAIGTIMAAIEAQRPLIGARYEEALERYTERLEALESAHEHLTPAQLQRARLLLRYALGSLQAGLGIKGALEYADALDQLPEGQIMAAAVRESYHVRRGNTRAADEWRRRIELLQVQLKRPYALKLRQTTQQIECSAHADDLEETKRNLSVLAELCEFYPSAEPYLRYARAEYARIRGDYTTALQHIHTCLSATEPGRHPVWPWAAACELECLRLANRFEEARAVGAEYVRRGREAGLRIMADHVEVFEALAEAELGEFDIAAAKIDRSIAYREHFGMRGLNLGWSYEARAIVALRMHDRAGFEHALQQCAINYSGGRDNPALAAKYERLLQEARAVFDDRDRLSIPRPIPQSSDIASSSLMVSHHLDPFLSCSDGESRARAALDALLAAASCERGQLFLLTSDGLELVAGEADEAHRRAAEALVEADDDEDDTATESEDENENDGAVQAILLTCPRGDQLATIGVLTLEEAPPLATSFYGTMRTVCQVLIDAGDVQPRLR